MSDLDNRASSSVRLQDTGTGDPSVITRVTYKVFILLVTLMSLVVMGLYYLAPMPDHVREVLFFLNYIDALILLFDVVVRFRRAPKKLSYILPWGILDFFGSLPGMPYLRLLRVPSLLLTWRELRRATPHTLVEVARSRLAESTLLSGIVVVFVVATFGGMAIVWVEAPVEGSNIKTGADALWYAIVTIATVGYGDRYPVTLPGRIIGSTMIIVGVGIFSVITGYISTQFLAKRKTGAHYENESLRQEMIKLFEGQATAAAADRAALEEQIAALRQELAEHQ